MAPDFSIFQMRTSLIVFKIESSCCKLSSGRLRYVTTESKGPRTKMLLVYVEAGDSSNQSKIKLQRQELQGTPKAVQVYYRKVLQFEQEGTKLFEKQS